MSSDFVWYELHTPDGAAAATFYRNVLGWETQDSGMTDRSYTVVSVQGLPVGGILQKPAGEKPGWLGYLGVDDVEAYTQRVRQAGGAVHREPDEIPGAGSFSVVADPQGAMFVLFQPGNAGQQRQSPAPDAPGSGAWHDLATTDWQAAFAFYSELFGWEKSQAMDMGSNGIYQIFASNGKPIGGMMNRMDPAQNPGWLFYFNVEQIEAAVARARQHGGTIVHGPSEVPGGQQISHCIDPQGAIFALVAPNKQETK